MVLSAFPVRFLNERIQAKVSPEEIERAANREIKSAA